MCSQLLGGCVPGGCVPWRVCFPSGFVSQLLGGCVPRWVSFLGHVFSLVLILFAAPYGAYTCCWFLSNELFEWYFWVMKVLTLKLYFPVTFIA